MIEKYVDAEELRRLVSSLLAVVGCIVLAALFAAIVVPGLRNANKPAFPAPAAAVVGETGWLDIREFPPQRGKIIPPISAAALLSPSADMIDRGRTLFDGNCVQCHGAKGLGNGPAAATMNPRPRNLTNSAGWVNGFEMSGVYKTLTEGIDGSSMAAFDFLAKRDRMALVHYVRSLGKFPEKPGEAEAANEWAKELESVAETVPNRIPVSMALSKLEEPEVTPPLFPAPDEFGPGAELIRRVVANPRRAAHFLSRFRGWRTSYRDLAAAVTHQAPANGFSIGSAALSALDWQVLHSELLIRTAPK